MVGACLALVLAHQQYSYGNIRSRAEFVKAIDGVKNGWSEDKVRRLLGPPDRIVFSIENNRQTWQYGLDGPVTCPTLGTVEIEDGVVDVGTRNFFKLKPPPTSLVPEPLLRKILNVMWRPNDFLTQLDDGSSEPNDPLRLIRATNALQRLGTDGAISVINEYCRTVPRSIGFPWNDSWLFWLIRCAFVSSNPDYVFRPPRLGSYGVPDDLSTWPTFPVALINDFPVTDFNGASLNGSPERFLHFENSDGLTIRPNALRPPDDPFLIYDEAMSFPGMSEEMLQREILRLVRNAYRPKSRIDGPVSRQEFEVLHKEYRSVGGHWDSTHELYARKDGKFDPDMYIDYSEQLVGSYDEAGTTTIVACRRLDRHRWKLINICLEAPNISVPTSFVAVRRQDSGVLVKGVRTSGLDVREIEPDQFFAKLVLALHHGEADRQISSATMESQPGTRFIADIYVGQSLRTSFVFAP